MLHSGEEDRTVARRSAATFTATSAARWLRLLRGNAWLAICVGCSSSHAPASADASDAHASAAGATAQDAAATDAGAAVAGCVATHGGELVTYCASREQLLGGSGYPHLKNPDAGLAAGSALRCPDVYDLVWQHGGGEGGCTQFPSCEGERVVDATSGAPQCCYRAELLCGI